jgi:dihydrofolate reductase
MSPKGLIATSTGKIPWNIPEDMEHFRKTTAGGIVIMGRTTWESLPPRSRPLSGRINIIMTREPLFKQVIESQPEGIYVATGMADLWGLLDQLDTAAAPRRIFIIGGAQIYRHFMPICEKLYLTEVNFADEDDLVGGTYFPLKMGEIEKGGGWVPQVSPSVNPYINVGSPHPRPLHQRPEGLDVGVEAKEWSISRQHPFLCYRMWEFVARG